MSSTTISAVLAQSTTYTPSPGCLAGLTVQTSSVDSANTTAVYIFPGTDLLSGASAPTTCLPEPYVNALRSATPANPVASPAVTCPVGYHQACSMVGAGANVAAGAAFLIWNALDYSQTAIGCCPANYQCVSQSPYQCISTLTAGETVRATTMIDQSASVTEMTTNASYQVTATAIRFVYMLNSTSGSGSFAFPNYSQSSGTLSVGAIIIIAVIAALIVGCIGGCCFWRRRRHKKMREEKVQRDQEAADAAAFGKSELDAGPPAHTIGSDAPEVVGVGPKELETPVAELPAGEVMVEMPGEGQGQANGSGIARKPLASPPLLSESPDIYGSSEVSASPVAMRHSAKSGSAEVAATPVEQGPPMASGAL